MEWNGTKLISTNTATNTTLPMKKRHKLFCPFDRVGCGDNIGRIRVGVTVEHTRGRPTHHALDRLRCDALRDSKPCCGGMSATVRLKAAALGAFQCGIIFLVPCLLVAAANITIRVRMGNQILHDRDNVFWDINRRFFPYLGFHANANNFLLIQMDVFYL